MVAPRPLRPGEALSLTDLGPTAAGVLSIGLNTVGVVPDLVAMLVGANAKVRTDDDLVFYNNRSGDGAVSWSP